MQKSLWIGPGLSLLIVLAVWVVVALTVQGIGRNPPRAPGVGSGFVASLKIPRAEVQKVFSNARAQMISRNSAGNTFDVLASIAKWTAFLLTSLITLIAGILGYQIKLGDAASAAAFSGDEKNRTKSRVKLIGILAATAAIATGASSQFSDEAKARYGKSDTIQKLVIQSRKDLLEASGEAEQREVLDNLRLKSTR